MRLVDLIEKLQDLHTEIAGTLSEDAADDTNMRLAINPAWATQHEIDDNRTIPWTIQAEDDDHEQQVVAWLPDGDQTRPNPYLPAPIIEQFGWR
jgi:hypothetical protein